MATTWGELKETMKDAPDDVRIVMAKDAEGNSFSPLETVEAGMYQPENTYKGHAFTRPDGPNMGTEDWEQWNDPDNVPVYIFWPTN